MRALLIEYYYIFRRGRIEVIGFTIGIIRLVETFIIYINYFNYVRIDRRLNRDYEILIIKLDFIRLRFTR